MKKLSFLILFISLAIYSYSQSNSLYNTTDNKYDEYVTRLGTNLRLAELSENDLIRSVGLMLEMAWSSMCGYSNDSLTALVAKYNTLYGTSYSIPNFTYSVTGYLSLDSLNLGGNGYLSVLLSTDSVNLLIEAKYDTIKKIAIDTTETHEFSSLYGHQVNVGDTFYMVRSGNTLGLRTTTGSDQEIKFSIGSNSFGITHYGGDYYSLTFNTSTTSSEWKVNNATLTWDGTNVHFDSDTILFFSDTTANKKIGTKAEIANLYPSGSQYVIQLSNGDNTFTSDADFTIQSDTAQIQNLHASGKVRFSGDIEWDKANVDDTVGLVMYPTELLDTMSLVSAGAGWDIHDNLEDYDVFYEKCKQLRSLPLPYPNGTKRRKINPLFMPYQIEYELERLHGYFKQLRDENKMLIEENIRNRAKIEALQKTLYMIR